VPLAVAALLIACRSRPARSPGRGASAAMDASKSKVRFRPDSRPDALVRPGAKIMRYFTPDARPAARRIRATAFGQWTVKRSAHPAAVGRGAALGC